MDFRFTEEEEAFRKELIEFFEKEVPPEKETPGDALSGGDWEFTRHMRRRMGEKGWLALPWPREYGGIEASHMKQVIFNEEVAYRRVPGSDFMGVNMLGSAILIHGTEEQKKEHLLPIAKGDVVWCQGYSEPESGSDLASLRTRAVEDGDDFVITGQKIWTSHAQYSDHIFILARTDPEATKHRGISFFLADMDDPGFSVRPIDDMSGGATFNEVFIDNVRVPKSNMVGELNRGWYVAMTLLDFERSGIEHPAINRRTLRELVEFINENPVNGRSLGQDPIIRNKLVDRAIEVEVCRNMAYNIAWMQSQGLVPNYESSAARVISTETTQRVQQTGMEILGLYGQLDEASRQAPLNGQLKYHYLLSVCYTIESGTKEIQRNVIATRGLGLPRM